jgi:hypothetical protein
MNNDDKPGCLVAILQALGLAPKTAEPEVLPYRIRDDFLSPAERSFYHMLHAAVGDWAVICPKVSLGDLFFAKSGDHKANTSYRNRIARKHVDFLLCDSQDMEPLLGIELDDASHSRAARQQRDSFVDQVFAAAELPLLRQPVQSTYDVHDLDSVLQSLAGKARQQATQVSSGPTTQTLQGTLSSLPAPVVAEEPPSCPKCGQPMVLRTAQRDGPHKGRQFWGCVDYPRCRGLREAVLDGSG